MAFDITKLRASWPMNETSGVRQDFSTYGNDLTPVASTITGVAGKIGNCVQINRVAPTDPYLESDYSASLGLGQINFTIWGWTRFSEFTALFGVLEAEDASTNTDWFVQWAWDNGANYRLVCRHSLQSAGHVSVSATIPVDTSWHFFLWEYIASTFTFNLYIDGVTTPTATTTFVSPLKTPAADFKAIVGQIAPGTVQVDALNIYEGLLDQDGKDCVYSGGDGQSYPFDECTEGSGAVWLVYSKGYRSGDDISTGTYGTPNTFLVRGLAADTVFQETQPIVDANGVATTEGASALFKVRRVGSNTDSRATDTNRQSLYAVEVSYNKQITS